MVSCVEPLHEMNGVTRSPSLSSHDMGFSISRCCGISADNFRHGPRCGLAVAPLLSVPQLAAFSAFALSAAEPKQAAATGGLCALSVLTHISCPKCLERQLKIHQDNRSREDGEEIGQTA